MVKNMPARLEIWVQSLSQEDPETGMATAVLLPGEPRGQRSVEGCSPRGRKELNSRERLIGQH